MAVNIGKLLRDLDACMSAQLWAIPYRDIEQMVENCYRGDWFLWLAQKINVDTRLLTLTKTNITQPINHLIPSLGRQCVLQAQRYGLGDKTITSVHLFEAYISCKTLCLDLNSPTMAAMSTCCLVDDGNTALLTAEAEFEDYRRKEKCLTSDTFIYIYNHSLKRSADISRELIGQEIINKVNNLKTQ